MDIYEVPCPPHQQTQLLANDLDDYDVQNNRDFEELLNSFLDQCPNKCRKEKYEAVHISEESFTR